MKPKMQTLWFSFSQSNCNSYSPLIFSSPQLAPFQSISEMVVKCFNRVSALKFLTEENPNFTLVHYNWTVGGDFYSLFLCITTEGPLASLSLLLRYYHWFAMVKLSVSFHLYCKGLICILITVAVVLFLMTRLLSRIRLISSCVLLRQIFFESIFSRSQKNLFCRKTKSRWKDFYNSWCNLVKIKFVVFENGSYPEIGWNID